MPPHSESFSKSPCHDSHFHHPTVVVLYRLPAPMYNSNIPPFFPLLTCTSHTFLKKYIIQFFDLFLHGSTCDIRNRKYLRSEYVEKPSRSILSCIPQLETWSPELVNNGGSRSKYRFETVYTYTVDFAAVTFRRSTLAVSNGCRGVVVGKFFESYVPTTINRVPKSKNNKKYQNSAKDVATSTQVSLLFH